LLEEGSAVATDDGRLDFAWATHVDFLGSEVKEGVNAPVSGPRLTVSSQRRDGTANGPIGSLTAERTRAGVTLIR
jgi:hypothetical protein